IGRLVDDREADLRRHAPRLRAPDRCGATDLLGAPGGKGRTHARSAGAAGRRLERTCKRRAASIKQPALFFGFLRTRPVPAPPPRPGRRRRRGWRLPFVTSLYGLAE